MTEQKCSCSNRHPRGWLYLCSSRFQGYGMSEVGDLGSIGGRVNPFLTSCLRRRDGPRGSVRNEFDPQEFSYRDLLEFIFDIPTRRASTASATTSARSTAPRSSRPARRSFTRVALVEEKGEMPSIRRRS